MSTETIDDDLDCCDACGAEMDWEDCGDSTYDHECNDKTVPCGLSACVDGRVTLSGALFALDAVRAAERKAERDRIERAIRRAANESVKRDEMAAYSNGLFSAAALVGTLPEIS